MKALRNKRVLLRVDLDVALKRGSIPFDCKLQDIIPTITQLLKNNCAVCLLSHIGCPRSPADYHDAYSLRPISSALEKLLHMPVQWLPNFPRDRVQFSLGSLYCAENTFYMAGEINNDPALTAQMLQNIDAVVFDTLVLSDAEYSSTRGLLMSNRPIFVGEYLKKTQRLYQRLMSKNLGLIVGGDNVAWQLNLISRLTNNLKFLAVGHLVGSAFLGRDESLPMHMNVQINLIRQALKYHKVKILYPLDVVAFSKGVQRNRLCLVHDLDNGETVNDLGVRSIRRILSSVRDSHIDLLLFSGTMGQHLDPRFARGTEALLTQIAQMTSFEKVVLGRDGIDIVRRLNLMSGYDMMLSGDCSEYQYFTSGDSRVFSRCHQPQMIEG